MATPLDIGLLHYFSAIFPFLLVFAVVYGTLASVKAFKDQKGLQAIVALCFAFMSLMFPIIRETISLMAPWIVFLMFFIIFLLVIIQMFGVNMGDIASVLKGDEWGSTIVYWIISLMLIIFLGSLFSVISTRGGIGKTSPGAGIDQPILNQTTGEPLTQEADFWRTIVHPKVLGIAFILLLSTFAIQKLTSVT